MQKRITKDGYEISSDAGDLILKASYGTLGDKDATRDVAQEDSNADNGTAA